MRLFELLVVSSIAWLAAHAPAYAQARSTTPSWTGFYAGASIGARVVDSTWTSTSVAPNLVAAGTLSVDPNPIGSFDSAAARLGGYLGHDWLIAPTWIAGVEADVGYANARDSRIPIPGTLQNDTVVVFSYINQPQGTVATTWDASLRGRIGYLITPDILVFAAPGVALQRIKIAAQCYASGGATDWCTVPHDESFSKTRVGWTIGGGVERMIGRWIARAEYRYADFGTVRHTFFNFDPAVPFDDRLTANVKVQTHTASFGLAYRFGNR